VQHTWLRKDEGCGEPPINRSSRWLGVRSI
jgi:hypothetical protein